MGKRILFNRAIIKGRYPKTYQDLQEALEGERNPMTARAIPPKYLKPLEQRIETLNAVEDLNIPNITILITNEKLEYGNCKCLVSDTYNEELMNVLKFDFKAVKKDILRQIARYRAIKRTRLKREHQKKALDYLLGILKEYRKLMNT